MRTHGIQAYPEVFTKADLLKVLPDGRVKELGKSTNIDFDTDRYDDIRDVATAIVHKHIYTATPMDVDKSFMAVFWVDPARSHDHTDVEDYAAPAEPDESTARSSTCSQWARGATQGGSHRGEEQGQRSVRRYALVVQCHWAQEPGLLGQGNTKRQAEG